jgi:hypothetical protein
MYGWEHNIKMDFEEMGWVDLGWIYMALDKDRWRVLVKT